MIDIDTALREMTETQEAVADMVLSDRFRNELSRIRLDLGVSPYLPISDEMCKWVVLAYLRSTQECATNFKREPVGTLNKMETVEPVAYVTGYRDGWCVISPVEHVVFPTGMALYMSPPKREPPTEQELEPIRRRMMMEAYNAADDTDFERYNALKVMANDVLDMLLGVKND